MVTINDLPKIINLNSEQYNLHIYIPAWDKVCVSYKLVNRSERILSCVVEPKGKVYLPINIEKEVDAIADATTIDEAIFITYGRVYELFNKGYLTIVKK